MTLVNWCIKASLLRACDVLHIINFRRAHRVAVNESPTNQFLPRLGLLSKVEGMLLRHVIKTQPSRSGRRQQIPRIEIDIHHVDYDHIKRVTHGYTRPAVFTNLLSNAPRQLDIEYLTELCGDKTVKVVKSGKEQMILNQVEMSTMKFSEFAERMQAGEALYLNNSSAVFDDNKRLRKDLMIGDITRLFTKRKPKPTAQIFIGIQGTRTDLHCAMAPNLFYNSYGKKNWVFIAPKDTHFLRSNLSRSGVYATSDYSIYADTLPEHFDAIEVFEATLQPGDVLFNPAFWWHSVYNETDYTIGVATRLFDGTIRTALHSLKQNPLFSFETIFLTRPFGRTFALKPKDVEEIVLDGLRKKAS